MNTQIIIDASVILSSILYQKPKTVQKLKEVETNKFKVITTSFFKSELTNGIRFSVKDPLDARELLIHALKLCDRFEEFKFNNLAYQKIMELAIENSTTAYDTAYHYIALATKSVLYTCDRDYFQKSRHLGYIEYLG